jgi:hypothetical protein
MRHVLIVQGVFGCWIVANAVQPSFAWTGSAWAPHDRGVPVGLAQVSNFPSAEEAGRYALQFGFVIAGVHAAESA